MYCGTRPAVVTVAPVGNPESVQLVNCTPLFLTLYANGRRVIDVQGFLRTFPGDRWWGQGSAPNLVEARPFGAPASAAAVWRGAASGDGPTLIRPGALIGTNSGNADFEVELINRTQLAAELVKIDANGTTRRVAVLDPDARHRVVGRQYEVVMLRALATGEPLDVCVLDVTNGVPLPITARRQQWPEEAWDAPPAPPASPPSEPTPIPTPDVDTPVVAPEWGVPAPAGVPEGAKLQLVGGARPAPERDSRDYLVISSHVTGDRTHFNTRANVATRTVAISGMTLEWNTLKIGAGLMSYQGAGVLDVERLEIFADHIVIASPLRFPGTNVSIHARVLEFVGAGSIDTTPLSYTARAASTFHTDDGHPANADGDPTYVAADGLNGDRGGDIELFIHTLLVPPGTTTRLIARGGGGQPAELGGLKRYLPTGPGQPEDSRDITRGIKATDLSGSMWTHFALAKSPRDWHWPDGVAGPQALTYQGAPLFDSGRVVDAVLVAHDDTAFVWDANVFYFPPGTVRQGRYELLGNPPVDALVDKGNKTNRARSDLGRIKPAARPGDGEDAYPGGRPGAGGAGGKIVTCLPAERFDRIRDLSGGPAGTATPAVHGAPAGAPNPAYQVQIDIVKKTFPVESKRKPTLRVTPVSAKAGSDAPGKAASAGSFGDVVTTSAGWLCPELVDAVLMYAADAARLGHRQLAVEALAPYAAEISAGRFTGELQARAIRITSILNNVRANLDHFGNPPGWLPRLRASTNFELFKGTREVALEMLYFGANWEKEYDSRQAEATASQRASAGLEIELAHRLAATRAAVDEVVSARLELEAVRNAWQGKKATLAQLESLLENETLPVVQAQRVFRGACKLFSGLLKVIPVGQPYLAFAGDIASSVGDVDLLDPSKWLEQTGKTLSTVGGHVDSFLDENQDLITEDRLKKLKTKIKFGAANFDRLDTHLEGVRASQENLEQAVAASADEIEEEWVNERAAQVADLNAQLAECTAEIATKSDPEYTRDHAEEVAALRQREIDLRANVGAVGAATLYQRRDDLRSSIAALDTEIEAIKASHVEALKAKNAARLKLLAKQRNELAVVKQRVDRLMDRRRVATDLNESHQEALETNEAQLESTFARLKKLGTGISTVGDAIATLAVPATADDDDVKAYRKHVLESPRGDELRQLEREITDLAGRQQLAITRLDTAQHQLAASVDSIADNLTAQNDLSQRRQQLDGALDIRAKRYLHNLQARARELMEWSMYHLAAAYRYEFLEDVSDDLYNYKGVVTRLQALQVKHPDEAPSPSELQEIDDTVFRAALVEELLGILKTRQSRVSKVGQNKIHVALDATRRELLRTTGRVTFNLVRSGKVNYNWIDARIVDVDVTTFALTSSEEDLELRLWVRHSGVSIIHGRDPSPDERVFYYFRKAPDDDAMEWGFAYNHADDGAVTKDATPEAADTLVGDMMDTSKIGRIELQEYWPSLFSDLTLRVTSGHSEGLKPVSRIDKVIVEITYTVLTESDDRRRHNDR